MGDGVLILGAGRLGAAWQAELTAGGAPPLALWSRRPEAARHGATVGPWEQAPLARADVVLLCVRDAGIESSAEALLALDGLRPGTVVLHGSGLKTSAALAGLAAKGARVGSLHPLQSFPTEPSPGRMRGVFFAVEGDPAAVEVGLALARRVGGRPRVIEAGQKAAYHASAVVASNLLVALADAAVDVAGLAGFGEEEALDVLLPLIEGSVANLRASGLPDALTGPITRGDVEVVGAHLVALEGEPDLAEVYRRLSTRAVAIARRQGAAREADLDSIEALLGGGRGEV